MDIDNPSYFNVCSSDFQQKMGNTESLSSASDCSRQSTPPRSQLQQNRRHLRMFLRSVSSNSADSNQELLIMGEPRLSDIAPDLAAKAVRSNSLKTKAEMHHDLVYSQLPTSEEAAAELPGDEVFIGEDTARYYNYIKSPRRHSICTFMSTLSGSVASSVKSFKEDLPQGVVPVAGPSAIDDHSLRHASYPRKRCSKCTRGTIKPANMDDILIVSLKCSEAANLWVKYFATYFQQISKQANRKPFKIEYMCLEDNAKPDFKLVKERITGVKLQLVVVCPGFLEFLSENPEKSYNVGKLLLADRTLALLLGVTDGDLAGIHRKVLPTYMQWQRLGVGQDQDENFTKEFLGHAMAILSRVWKQQSSISNQEKSGFSVSPKKIKQGQNSVFILLTYPLQKDDILKISIEKNNEIFEIKSVKRRNPYTVKISVPDNLTEVTAIINILVEKNGSIVGSRPIKCESKLRELEQILRLTNNPIEFMCQTLGFNPVNKDQLDNWLLHAFQRNLPAHFNLLTNHATPFAAAVHAHKHSHEEYPTLLHFAAKFGFEKLAMQLLDCPGADIAYDIRNVYDMTPAEIAETSGHLELATTLRGYMNMNEFSNMYAKLKEMSAGSKLANVDEESYLTPKNLEEFYKICPAPRPVTLDIPTSECTFPIGYMEMNTPKKEQKKPDSPKIDLVEQPKNCDVVLEDKVQKELLEIINDFKNNIHSISQVEKLVDEWKNRNDVQKSFKEKQEQLKEMRLKYDKIQQEMKSYMKKSTPFERVKKLFGRSKSREDKPEPGSIVPVVRPISSLSTSSSGSSGRMSTISASSLGDSGTHSDNEERKNILTGSHSEEDFRNELNRAVLELNYTPVPAPKPVKIGMFTNRNVPFETIEEKPVMKPGALGDEYYIQFPPSGLPIPGVIDKKSENQEYMNITAETGRLVENLNGNHEYMNFKIVTNR